VKVHFYISEFHEKVELTILPESFIKNKTNEQLLEKSIEKWQFIVDHMKEHSKIVGPNDNGCVTCACCMKYFWKDDCKGCPIYEFTGWRHCEFTPYGEYLTNRTIQNARKELNFLKKVKIFSRKRRIEHDYRR